MNLTLGSLLLTAAVGAPDSALAQVEPQDSVLPSAESQISEEQILVQASEALSSSPTLTFDFRIEERQGEDREIFEGQGLSAAMDGSRRRVRLAGRRNETAAATTEPSTLMVVDDGTLVTVVDHGERVEWSSPLYRAGGILFQVWTGKFMNSIAAPEALPPLVGLGPTRLDDEVVDGVACHALEIPIPGGVTGTVWVGIADGLPRRAILDGGGFRSQTDLTQWHVVADETATSEFVVGSDPDFEQREFTLGGPAPGESAPDFELEAVDGATVRLADLKGKVVILDFWATWCIPCRASMSELEQLHSELEGKPLEIVSVTYQESGDPAALIAELGISYPWYNGDEIAATYGVDRSGLPTMFLIGPDGRVLDFFYGFTGDESAARLRTAVDNAL